MYPGHWVCAALCCNFYFKWFISRLSCVSPHTSLQCGCECAENGHDEMHPFSLHYTWMHMHHIHVDRQADRHIFLVFYCLYCYFVRLLKVIFMISVLFYVDAIVSLHNIRIFCMYLNAISHRLIYGIKTSLHLLLSLPSLYSYSYSNFPHLFSSLSSSASELSELTSLSLSHRAPRLIPPHAQTHVFFFSPSPTQSRCV